MEIPFAFIVEDDPEAANIFSVALEMAGYKTETVTDGQQALDRLGEVTPYLLILDLHLPTVDGEDILDAILADKRLMETRVFIASADGLLSDSLRNKVDLVLNKPVSFRQLRTLARRFHPDQNTNPGSW